MHGHMNVKCTFPLEVVGNSVVFQIHGVTNQAP